MGKEALTSMFQEALAEGKLGDVDFIGAVRDIPGKKRCGTFYVDDQICDTVKTPFWIGIIGGLIFVIAVPICYFVHKRNKSRCTGRTSYCLAPTHDNNGVEDQAASVAFSLPENVNMAYDSEQEQEAVAIDSKEEYSAGNAGDGAEAITRTE